MEFDQTVQNRWLLSCVLGILSVVLPFTPIIKVLGYISGYLFLPLWVGGVLMGLFSILAEEKHRRFAWAGIALSLAIPAYAAISMVAQENPTYRHEIIDAETGKVIGAMEIDGETIYYTKDRVDSSDRTQISDERYNEITTGMSNK